MTFIEALKMTYGKEGSIIRRGTFQIERQHAGKLFVHGGHLYDDDFILGSDWEVIISTNQYVDDGSWK